MKSLVSNVGNPQKEIDALTAAYQILKDSNIVQSEEQFKLGITLGREKPIRLSEAATMVGVSAQWLRQLEKEGKLKIYRPTRYCYVKVADVIDLMYKRGKK